MAKTLDEFLDDDPPVEVVEKPPLERLPRRPRKKPEASLAPPSASALARKKQEELKNIEEDLFRGTMGVLRDVTNFTAVMEVDDEKIPGDWVREFGLEEARRRYKGALAGAMSSKDAPVGVKVAMATAIGISKARAMEKGGAPIMNATFIQINNDPRVDPDAVVRVYPRKLLDE